MVTKEDLLHYGKLTTSDFNRQVAALLDCRICKAYKLTPNNFIAHDIRYEKNDYSDKYSKDEKDAFIKHLLSLRKYEKSCDIEELMDIFLGIYSNPVESKREYAEITL